MPLAVNLRRKKKCTVRNYVIDLMDEQRKVSQMQRWNHAFGKVTPAI